MKMHSGDKHHVYLHEINMSVLWRMMAWHEHWAGMLHVHLHIYRIACAVDIEYLSTSSDFFSFLLFFFFCICVDERHFVWILKMQCSLEIVNGEVWAVRVEQCQSHLEKKKNLDAE